MGAPQTQLCLVAQDARDLELARCLNDDLMVEIPQDAWKAWAKAPSWAATETDIAQPMSTIMAKRNPTFLSCYPDTGDIGVQRRVHFI